MSRDWAVFSGIFLVGAIALLLLALLHPGTQSAGAVGQSDLDAFCRQHGGIRLVTQDALTHNSSQPGYYIWCSDGHEGEVR